MSASPGSCMLARSSASEESSLASVVERTQGIIFLGTPHRGSQDFVAVADWVQKLLSSLGMETTTAIIDALGLRTTDLERAQEAFSSLWRKHNFRVKTFQEAHVLTGINVGILAEKVVPDYSSLLGDERERAETIQANHREMCRFSGPDDPNYTKVSGELLSVYKSIQAKIGQTSERELPQQALPSPTPAIPVSTPRSVGSSRILPSLSLFDLKGSDHRFTEAEKAFIGSLFFPNMADRGKNVKTPARGTCSWLYRNSVYSDWYTGRSREVSRGLLRLMGKPGAGKSVLMKESYRRAVKEHQNTGDHLVAAFFFNSRGGSLERSATGAFRSLLCQLLCQDRGYLAEVANRHIANDPNRLFDMPKSSAAEEKWGIVQLEDLMYTFLLRQKKRVFIFIDGLDECATNQQRQHAYFWRNITDAAYRARTPVDLNVVISSRRYQSTQLAGCPEIHVDQCNRNDIAAYIEQMFVASIAAAEPDWHQLRDALLSKANGVFLWAFLVVEDLLKMWEEGQGLRSLVQYLDGLPDQLRDLFSEIFASLDPEAKDLTLRLFQWAALSVRPLRLHEWRHILGLIRDRSPSSLREWRSNDSFPETDDHLERQIRALSRGLLEFSFSETIRCSDTMEDIASMYARAGSFTSESGDDIRVVQVIHGSVRQFFLSDVFLSKVRHHPSELQEMDMPMRRGDGHISIMNMCIDYLHIEELDALVDARKRLANRQPVANPDSSIIETSITDKEAADDMDIDSAPQLSKAEGAFSASITQKETIDCMDIDNPDTAEEGKGDTWPAGAEGIDTLGWVTSLTEDTYSDPNTSPHIPSHVPPSVSLSPRTEVLEEIPALLSYAVDELFRHAGLARQSNANLEPVFARLSEKDTWERWLVLSEDEFVETCSFALYLEKKGFHRPIRDGQSRTGASAPPKRIEQKAVDKDDKSRTYLATR
ncbi:hypothetical protein OQA88_11123 [Cercophora sp. LCS_1]